MSHLPFPKELFEQYAAEYQTKINKSQQELGQLRGQLSAKQRERKLTELTNQELSGLEAGTNCYRSVGKMFLKEDLKKLTGELTVKIEVCAKEIQAMEKLALKADQDKKDAERNFDSLIKKVQESHAAATSAVQAN